MVRSAAVLKASFSILNRTERFDNRRRTELDGKIEISVGSLLRGIFKGVCLAGEGLVGGGLVRERPAQRSHQTVPFDGLRSDRFHIELPGPDDRNGYHASLLQVSVACCASTKGAMLWRAIGVP